MPDDDDLKPLGYIESPEGIVNAANASDVRKRKKQLESREGDKARALVVFMKLPGGRAFLHDLLESTMAFSPIASADFNPSALLFREGARQVGLRVADAAWRASPELYKLMMDDHDKPLR